MSFSPKMPLETSSHAIPKDFCLAFEVPTFQCFCHPTPLLAGKTAMHPNFIQNKKPANFILSYLIWSNLDIVQWREIFYATYCSNQPFPTKNPSKDPYFSPDFENVHECSEKCSLLKEILSVELLVKN